MAGPQVFEGPNSAVSGRPTHDSGSALGAYNSSPGLEAVTNKRHNIEEAVDDRLDGTVLDIYAKICRVQDRSLKSTMVGLLIINA